MPIFPQVYSFNKNDYPLARLCNTPSNCTRRLSRSDDPGMKEATSSDQLPLQHFQVVCLFCYTGPHDHHDDREVSQQTQGRAAQRSD